MNELTSSQGTMPCANGSRPALPLLKPGEQVADRFEILERLSKGGMSVVYHARPVGLFADRGLPSEVALKAVAAPDGRFVREAHLGEVFRHKNVCEILAYGEDPRGFGYIAMPLLRGETFEAFLLRGQQPFEELCPYFLQILSALQAASEAGIVHRDIKPANIVIDRSSGEPTMKILDFGLSKWRALGGESTASDEVFGTPYYMSPEQVRSTRETDVRTDLWSVGVMLYEAVTGRKPFEGSNAHEVFTAIQTQQPPRPSQLNPEVSPSLEAVILCAMESDREDRFSSPDQMSMALDAAVAGNTLSALAPWIALGVTPKGAVSSRGERLMGRLTGLAASFGGTVDPGRRSWHWLAAFGLVGAAVATVTGLPGLLSSDVPRLDSFLILPSAISALSLAVLSFFLFARSSARDARNGRRPGLAAAEAISIVHSPYLWFGALAFGLSDSLEVLPNAASTALAQGAAWIGAAAYAMSAALHAWLAGRAGSPKSQWPASSRAPLVASLATLLFLGLLLSSLATSIGASVDIVRSSDTGVRMDQWALLYWRVASTTFLAWGLQVVGSIAALIVAYGRRTTAELGVDPACGPAGTAAAVAFSELLRDELRIADGVAGFLLLCAVMSERPALLPLAPIAMPGVYLLLGIVHRARQRTWLAQGPGATILDEEQRKMFDARAINSLPLILFAVVGRREMGLIALCAAIAGLSAFL
ncbi:MAG: serine/threonine protein kinase [Myxococcota bacterium]|jgi:serine/threonine-protein kinase|nr:serine/threonine protein kinase [Myxococcota bacterium]